MSFRTTVLSLKMPITVRMPWVLIVRLVRPSAYSIMPVPGELAQSWHT